MGRLTVRVTPRASRDAVIAPGPDGAVRVRVTAAPVAGVANQAVTKLLSEALQLPARDVVLVSGANTRLKQFEVPLDADTVRARLLSAG